MNENLKPKFKIIQNILIKIAIIIFIVEMLVMRILPLIPFELTSLSEAFIDSALLTLFCTPFIYYFVIRPFVQENDDVLSKISHMAYHDPLTGLANRRLLSEYIDQELHCHLSDTNTGAILLMDLDGFKAINDTYGHLAGDRLLEEVAKRLQEITRDSDLISRIGGDEFVILVKKFDGNNDKASEKSLIFAQKILDKIVKPIVFNNTTLHVNVSIGIRIFNSLELGFDSLLKDADLAMYHSKDTGKGKATLYTDALK